MTILEQGELTNENLEAVVDRQIERCGVKRVCIPKDVEEMSAWWKCRDEAGVEFLYFGTPESFIKFQKERVN